jgi:hypothetical protein
MIRRFGAGSSARHIGGVLVAVFLVVTACAGGGGGAPGSASPSSTATTTTASTMATTTTATTTVPVIPIEILKLEFRITGGDSGASATGAADRIEQALAVAGFDVTASAGGDGVVVVIRDPGTTEPREIAALVSGGPLYLRPVQACADEGAPPSSSPDASVAVVSDPTSVQVLALQGGGMCRVGPAMGTGGVFADDAEAKAQDGQWIVTVSLRPDGVGVWNAAASHCYNRYADCLSQRLALESDGLIVTAPVVQQAEFEGSVLISGIFDKRFAQGLANKINDGAGQVTLQLVAVTRY